MAFLATLLCWGPPAAGLAQSTAYDPEYVITTWQTEDGLPENSATAIVQSPDGYLWFGTFKGLVRFDGVKFSVFDATNTPGLPGPGIVNLHLDRSERLWVSTTGGLAYLQHGRWQQVGAAQGWAGDYVRWFAEARDGRLYVSSFDGVILQFAGARFERLPDPRPGSRRGTAFFPFLDAEERLCVLQTGLAARWLDGRWQPLDLEAPLVLGDRYGWLRAHDATLVEVADGTLRRLRDGKLLATRPMSDRAAGFWSLNEDSRGFLWFSSYSNGLYRIAPDGQTRRFSIASGFPADYARCVFEDRQANLWVGTNGGGLVRMRPRRFASYGPAQGLPPSGFKSVAIGTDGVAHVAAYGYGLHRVRAGISSPSPVPAKFAYPQTVLVDRAGRLWAGTFRSGLYVSEAGRWTQLLSPPRTVSTLFEDAQGRVWAATPGGVLVWREPGQPPRAISVPPPALDIRCFAEDAKGTTLWAGGSEGLYRLAAERFERIPAPEGLAGFEVTSLHADSDARLWVGTSSAGLWLREADRWIAAGARTGLPVLAISGLHEQDGFLWAATNRGIWRTVKARLVAGASEPGSQVVWQSFGVSDGLPSIECSSTSAPSIARDAQGRLWFCTLKGLAAIDPSRLESATADMPVHVERLEYVDKAGRSHETPDPALPGITVPAGSRDFGIFFTAIDLTAPEKVLFSSRLERDGQVVASTVSSRREIRFPALQAGEYRFALRARNGDGVWSARHVDLRFTLRPYPWQTPWFRLLALLLAAAAVALVTRRLTLARSRRAQQLSELQARLALVLQNTNDAVTFTAPDDTVTYMNEAAARLLGLPGTRVESLKSRVLYAPWAYERLSGPGMEAVNRTGSWQGYSAFRHADGHEIPVWQLLVAHRNPGGAVEFVSSIARDMTELERMEAQVRQAQKMESVGLLAGGVAHDFNNLLQVIQAHTALARRPTISAAQRDTHLQNVVEAADRAGRLTRQLLAFGRRQPLKLEPTDVAELVTEHLRMVRRVIGEDIVVELVTGPNLGSVRCDRTQLEQVVLNLCVNARDAMPGGGRLTIALEDLVVDAGYVSANPWAQPGRYVMLSVADTGCGMDAATRERIFEPFFTTKASGTGLGLSVVYGIVRQHGGMVRVYSEPGAGTTFKLYLPSDERRGPEAEGCAAVAPAGGHETILVAEDDPAVAGVTRSVLESAGYSVLLAHDGAEAVRLFREHSQAVDLLLLDFVMPGMGGREARDEMRRCRPLVPVLFCSGHDPQAERTARDGPGLDDPVLEKPYDPSALLHRVREILDRASGNPPSR